ncbi:MAG TPA: hypothetical protein PLD47_02685 [Aggregatilineales bacterium]|nr:hypothetical protein [Anaerolineales bacterium]HRE46607.1 hypothetical protein [Aggregatilineales bacterium]
MENTPIARDGMQAETQSDVAIFTIGYSSGADESVLRTIAEGERGAFRAGSTSDIRQVYLEISTFF